jgi:hypothetical protein
MRIDSPLMTNAIATGSFSGSFVGSFDGDITADSVAYDNITGKPTLISSSAQIGVGDGALTQNNFTNTLKSKLDAIEASATADQTDAQIRAAVEAATDSNVFTDADHTKLNAIEASADVTDTTNVTAAGALMDSELAEIATVKALSAAGISGSLSAAALVSLGANLISGSASDVRTFLNVEDGATADQSNAEIRAAVEAATDSNVFTDADHTKLNAIEASADVTDTTNVTSAGALMDSEVSALALIKGLTAAQISGSGNVRFEALNAATSSYALISGASLISASVLSSPSQGTIRLATNGVNTDVDSGLQSGDSPTFSGLAITNDVTINGNLNVLGTKTELQVATLNVEDKNILIASGAADSAAADGAGLSIDGADKALTWNHANTRFNFDAALNVAGNITTSGTVDGRDIDSDGTKLDGIEASATADQSNAEIRAAVEAATDSNVFTDADHTKLNGIEASADVTDATNVTAAGALMDSEVSALALIKGLTAAQISGSGNVRFEALNAATSSYALGAVDLTAGAGLTGGGTIAANRTFNIGAGTGVTVNANDIAIGQAVATSSDVRFDSIGVNTAAPGTSGVIRAASDIIAFYSSDERLKDNVVVIDNALEKVESLRGVEFDWNDKQEIYEGHDVGVIAQDVEKVLPELVENRDNGYKAVKYEKLTAVLIQAVKELSAKVKELENK